MSGRELHAPHFAPRQQVEDGSDDADDHYLVPGGGPAAAFEQGVMLTRSCQSALKEAEQKVEILLKRAGEPTIADFDALDEAEDPG